MNIVAYAARRYAEATRLAVGSGARLLTCPPVHDGIVDPAEFTGRDLVVFNLHGLPEVAAWLGGDGRDDQVPALKATTLRSFKLGGAGVFAINCHLGDTSSPMREALRDAGAGWVIGGPGVNFGGLNVPAGADVLLQWFIRSLRLSRMADPEQVLKLAKRALKLFSSPFMTPEQRRVLDDTLGFRVWRFDS